MVPLEEVMVLTGASSRLIHRLIEAGRIHFQEVPDTLPFICLDSLLDFSRKAALLMNELRGCSLTLKRMIMGRISRRLMILSH